MTQSVRLRNSFLMLAASIASAALFAGCSASTAPTAQTPVDVSGVWGVTTCSKTPPFSCVMTFTLTLSQSGTSLSGEWADIISSGKVTGTVVGSTVQMTMTFPVSPSCPLSLTAAVSGNQLTGQMVN